MGHDPGDGHRQIRSGRQQGGVFGAGVPEYRGGVNHPTSFQRAAFRPSFILIEQHGEFFFPVKRKNVLENMCRSHRHGKSVRIPWKRSNSTLNSPLSTLEQPFVPQYDASGNQTLIKISTGIWTVVYNAANRAVSFTSQDGNIVVECGYDYQGRRYTKKVTENGTITSHERYLYRGYLQIAALDMLNSRNVLRTLLWDPLEPMATRPVALVRDNALYCYNVDFNKNVTEVFDEEGSIAAAYDYSPYGQVASTGDLVQPVQWSSEMNDGELSLVYYNYRYYHPSDGRWINRDPVAEEGGWNLYLSNGITYLSDYIGLNRYITHFDIAGYGGSGTTTLHVGVAVDQWIEKEGKYIKNGIVTYDFAAVLTEKTGFW
jgi:RHS repeat-associated protein